MKLGYCLIYVDDVPQTMKFYEKAFGFEPGFLHESHQYGEMVSGQTKLGFVHHETAGSHGFDYEAIKATKKAPGFEIGLVTHDVENAYSVAVSAGAQAVSKPMTKPWGQTVSYVRDLNGVLVEICSPMGD